MPICHVGKADTGVGELIEIRNGSMSKSQPRRAGYARQQQGFGKIAAHQHSFAPAEQFADAYLFCPFGSPGSGEVHEVDRSQQQYCQRDNPNDPQLSGGHGLYDVPFQHRGMYFGDGLEAMAVVFQVFDSVAACVAEHNVIELPGCFIRVVAVVQQEIREREGVFPLVQLCRIVVRGPEELKIEMGVIWHFHYPGNAEWATIVNF